MSRFSEFAFVRLLRRHYPPSPSRKIRLCASVRCQCFQLNSYLHIRPLNSIHLSKVMSRISGSSAVLINRPVYGGDWHHVIWTRRYKHITLTLDDMFTAQADLPGVDTEFNTALEPVISVDIGGLPAGVTQAKGKVWLIYHLCFIVGGLLDMF